MNELPLLLLTFQLSIGGAPSHGEPVRHALRMPPAVAAAALPPPPDDRWLGEDKLRHFFLSFAATGMAYGAARMAGLGKTPALVAGAAGAAAAGAWKEWRDHRAGEGVSLKDLAWDAAGIGVGLALMRETH